jgi:hypothetical protein
MMHNKTLRADQRLVSAAEEEATGRLWCDACGTDEFLFIESVRRRHWAPPGFVDVSYFCAECDGYYGHLVNEDDISPRLLAAMAVDRLHHVNGTVDESA